VNYRRRSIHFLSARNFIRSSNHRRFRRILCLSLLFAPLANLQNESHRLSANFDFLFRRFDLCFDKYCFTLSLASLWQRRTGDFAVRKSLFCRRNCFTNLGDRSRPQIIIMITLNPNEKLIVVFRKHWLVFIFGNLPLLVFAIAPLIFSGFFSLIFPGLPVTLLYIIWLLALWVAFAVSWTNFYLDLWYLTDERLVDIDQKGMFLRNEATLRFPQIQDVTIETGGILGTLIGYGTIIVQTAGESPEFRMPNVANPEKLKETILALTRDFLARPQKVEVA
jgi:membrane protein YdbS with pleckstrin-like domain